MHSQSKIREDLHVSTLEADAPASPDPFDGLFADSSFDSFAAGTSDAEQRRSDQQIVPPLEEDESAFALESELPASAALSHEVNQALARLEMNSLQVKLHLDSIDERIKRMEPRLEQRLDEQQIPLAAPAQTPETEVHTASDLPSYLLLTPSTTDRRRRRLNIPPSASIDPDLPLSPTDRLSGEDLWALKHWLLARRKQLAIAGVVFLAFVTILTFGTGTHSATPAVSSVPANTPVPAPLGSEVIPKASAGISVSPARDPPSPAGADPQLDNSSVQAAGSPPADPRSTTTVSSAPEQKTARGESNGTSASENDVRASGAKPSASISVRTVPASGRVRVSSGVMAGNLLYSPTPKFPGGFATLFHMEGEVTMQAIIARNGSVENVHVLSGHHLLRGAAQDTVRTWRYRPYAINGVPVEVATIVTVEFHR